MPCEGYKLISIIFGNKIDGGGAKKGLPAADGR